MSVKVVGLVWRDPPSEPRTKREFDTPRIYDAVANELRANPGRWAVVGANTSTWKIRGLETVTRLGEIYARYNPDH